MAPRISLGLLITNGSQPLSANNTFTHTLDLTLPFTLARKCKLINFSFAIALFDYRSLVNEE